MKHSNFSEPHTPHSTVGEHRRGNLIRLAVFASPILVVVIILVYMVTIGNSFKVNSGLLKTDSNVLKKYAAKRLGRIGDTGAVPLLTDTLTDDDAAVRLAAVRALGELGDPGAVEPIGAAIVNSVRDGSIDTDDELFIKTAILSILEIIGHNHDIASDVSNLLLDDDYLKPLRNIVSNGERRLNGVDPASSSERTKWSRIIRDTYCAALGEEDPNIRLFAMMLLGETNDINPIIALLEDDNDSVRLCAAMTLRDLVIHSAFVVLIEFLDHPDPGVRLMIVESLEGVRNIREADVLIRAFDDVASDVRERAVDIILASYDDYDTDTRMIVIAAIGELGNKEMKEVLINALDDPDDLVRVAAVVGLWKMGEKEMVLETAKSLIKSDAFFTYITMNFCNINVRDEDSIDRDHEYDSYILSTMSSELRDMVAEENYLNEMTEAPLNVYGDWVADWILQGGEIDCDGPHSMRSMDTIFYMIPDGTAITPLYGSSSVTLIVPKGTDFTIEGLGHNNVLYWDENGRTTTAGYIPDIEVDPDVKRYLAGLNDPRIDEVLADCDDD